MSAIHPDEQKLEDAARDGSLDITEWPQVLESLLQRLHNVRHVMWKSRAQLINQIVHHDFPIPQNLTPPTTVPSSTSAGPLTSTPPQPSNTSEQADLPDLPDFIPASQQSTKENDAPTENSSAIPPQLLSSYQSSVRILERDFAEKPPYTVQRLSELILQPRKHYRYLPAYLRALDRVVSVSSPATDFPLPTGVAINGGFLTNGDLDEANGIQEREGLGSDESLGGALLTPIPWLRNSNALAQDGEFHSERMETTIGPNGLGSIETVTVTVNGVPSASSAAHTSPNTSTPASPTLSEQSDASTNSSGSMSTDAQLREQGGVTQGELLRQEQEAGVIPVAQAVGRRMHIATDYAAASRESAPMLTTEPLSEEEDLPHARGPEVIGMEDTGLVQNTSGLDIEAAVGRGRSKSPQPPLVPPEEPVKDQNGDVIITD